MNNLKVFGLMLLSVLASMALMYGIGRKSGKKAVELQQTNHTLKVIRRAKDVELEIAGDDIDTIRDRVHNKWTIKD